MDINNRYSILGRLFYSRLLTYIGLFFIALIFGIASSILPVEFIVIFLTIPLFLFLSLKFSEYAVFLLVLVLLGGIPSSYLPQITIAGGTLRAEDIGLVFLFALLAVKKLGTQKQQESVFFMLKPYLVPLGGLLFIAVLSAMIAVLYKTAPIKDVFIEVRPFLSWLLLPILFLAIDTEKKMIFFKKMIVILVALLSLIAVFESFTGISFTDKGQALRALWTSGQGSFDSVNRRTTLGIFLILAVLMYLISRYVLVNKPIKNVSLSLLLIMILLLAILVGFRRGVWLSIFVLIILLGFLSHNSKYLKLIFWMATISLILVLILSVVKPSYLDAAAKRVLSVSSEVKEGKSLGRRFIENDYAIDKILENPILGVGLGGHYKPAGMESILWPAEVRYIHNSYVYIATKLGIFGLFFVLFFVIVLFQRLYRAYKAVDKDSGLPMIFAIFSLLLTTLILTGFTQPNLVSVGGIVSIVIAIFLLESIIYRGKNKTL